MFRRAGDRRRVVGNGVPLDRVERVGFRERGLHAGRERVDVGGQNAESGGEEEEEPKRDVLSSRERFWHLGKEVLKE